MSAKWSKCVQTTITGKTSEQLREMKAKSSNDQKTKWNKNKSFLDDDNFFADD